MSSPANLFGDRSGTASIEYGLISAMLGAGLVLVLANIGGQQASAFTVVTNALQVATGSGSPNAGSASVAGIAAPSAVMGTDVGGGPLPSSPSSAPTDGSL